MPPSRSDTTTAVPVEAMGIMVMAPTSPPPLQPAPRPLVIFRRVLLISLRSCHVRFRPQWRVRCIYYFTAKRALNPHRQRRRTKVRAVGPVKYPAPRRNRGQNGWSQSLTFLAGLRDTASAARIGIQAATAGT